MVINSSLILKAIVNRKMLRDQVDIALVSKIKNRRMVKSPCADRPGFKCIFSNCITVIAFNLT